MARVQVRLSPSDDSTQAGLAQAALELTAAGAVEDVLRIATLAAQVAIGVHQAVTSRLVHGWTDASTYVSLSDKYARWRDYDRVPEGLGVLNYVTRENRPLRLTGQELAAHPEWRGLRDAPDHPPLPNYLAAPLVGRDGSNLGLIQLSDKADGSEFTADDEAILVQLAQMASNALSNIELLDREHEARLAAEEASRQAMREKQRIEALSRVGSALTARLELHEIVQLATDAATEMTPAEFGAFFYNVEDEAGESYMLYTLSGAPLEAFERFPMPRNTAIFGPTFSGEAVVRLDDVTRDPRFGRNEPYKGMPKGHLPVRSYLAVPVVTPGGSVAGGLFFGHPEPGVFSSEDEEMVVGIAGQAAIAIENARLYRERSRTAQTLQRALLPPHMPEIPHLDVATRYRAAGEGIEVGGDFYDVVELAQDRHLVVIGDVCGKGPQAATVTALARYTLRAHAPSGHSPAELLTKLNDALLAQRAPGFCTVALGCLSRTATGATLVMSNGGHLQPLVVRRGGHVSRIGSVGTLLGVIEGPDLTEDTVELDAGDMLVLFTDGVTEAAAPQTILNDEDVAAIISGASSRGASSVADALERTAVEMSGGAPRDDIAIVVLGVTSAPRPGERMSYHRVIAAGPEAGRETRDALQPLMAFLDARLFEDVRLLATELVANAVRHVRVRPGNIELHLVVDTRHVRVVVRDEGPGFRPPPSPIPAPDGPGGWGLHIIDERADRWGIEGSEHPAVWFEIDRGRNQWS